MSVLCPQCHHNASPRCTTRDFNARTSDEPFHYFRCAACGLVWLHPVPLHLGRSYTPDYIAYTVPDSMETLRRQARPYACRLEHVLRWVSCGTLLEIGPSYGAFALLAKDAGFQVNAIEMDARCCAFLKDVVGIQVLQASDIQRALMGSGLYNVIALWHTIEHLPDALAVLPLLATHVAPGGILALSTPNPDALQFRCFGPYWAHLDAPRHVVLLPLRLLDAVLATAGLRRMFFTQTDVEGLTLNRFGWTASMRHRFHSPVFKYSRYAIGLMLNSILRPWESVDGRGCAYTAIYQRMKSVSWP